jgi:uncharacterized protein (TIGR03790 family)
VSLSVTPPMCVAARLCAALVATVLLAVTQSRLASATDPRDPPSASHAPEPGDPPSTPHAPEPGDPRSVLHAPELGVIINTEDPLSTAIGNYYIAKRNIPPANVARIAFNPDRSDLPAKEFEPLRAKVQAMLPARVQAYAITWARPYRVGCMSITSAFAFGIDPKFCATGCVATRLSPYFNAPSSLPYDDLHIRPTMAIAASDMSTARQLIDRGITSDGTFPKGTAYLVTTNDAPRNARTTEYPRARSEAEGMIGLQMLPVPAIRARPDVLFYFIGAVTVPDLLTNHFVPGAIADHLTSFGGMLTDSHQMSSLRWIEAGATGSYGTVVEPCSMPAKFPDIPVLIHRYLAGETLVEAYWKSVAMPGQGIFIGEPLAAPFRPRS